MPSVSVPLYERPGWDKLMAQRKAFWAKSDNDVLTPHFKASEFYCHDASPPPIVSRPAMIRLCEIFLEPMRETFGACFVLSGYRHVVYNAKIGGARQSQHIYEQTFEAVASDLRFQRGSPSAWAAEAKRLRGVRNKGNGGVGTYVRAGFVHVDNRGWQADWMKPPDVPKHTHEIALWASVAAFFGSLLAIGLFDVIDADQWAEYLGAIIVAVITAGAVYSKERLEFAKKSPDA